MANDASHSHNMQCMDHAEFLLKQYHRVVITAAPPRSPFFIAFSGLKFPVSLYLISAMLKLYHSAAIAVASFV